MLLKSKHGLHGLMDNVTRLLSSMRQLAEHWTLPQPVPPLWVLTFAKS